MVSDAGVTGSTALARLVLFDAVPRPRDVRIPDRFLLHSAVGVSGLVPPPLGLTPFLSRHQKPLAGGVLCPSAEIIFETRGCFPTSWLVPTRVTGIPDLGRVTGFGFQFSGVGLRVDGFQFRFWVLAHSSGFRIWGCTRSPAEWRKSMKRNGEDVGNSGFRVRVPSLCLGFRVQSREEAGFRVVEAQGSVSGCQVHSGFRVRVRVQGSRSGLQWPFEGSGFGITSSPAEHRQFMYSSFETSKLHAPDSRTTPLKNCAVVSRRARI